jgi:hypothetical protein
MKKKILGQMEEAYTKSKTLKYSAEDWNTDNWEAIR